MQIIFVGSFRRHFKSTLQPNNCSDRLKLYVKSKSKYDSSLYRVPIFDPPFLFLFLFFALFRSWGSTGARCTCVCAIPFLYDTRNPVDIFYGNSRFSAGNSYTFCDTKPRTVLIPNPRGNGFPRNWSNFSSWSMRRPCVRIR